MFDPTPLVVQPPGDDGLVRAAAIAAASHWNLAAPELIRLGANGVFGSGDVILRISRATAPMHVALDLARLLAGEGIRVAVPARTDVVTFDNGLTVTAWQRVEHDPSLAVDWEHVGAMIAKVHIIDPTRVGHKGIGHPLPFCASFPWWDFDMMMSEADGLDATTRAALEGVVVQYGWWADAALAKPLVVCHGDVHPGNVVVDRDGPVLLDWDLLCLGPPAWDHAPLMTWTRRWGGERGIYEAFCAGYGTPIDDEIAHAVAEMRLLAATLMRLQRARFDPAHRDEATRRLAYWRGDPNAPMWRAQ